MNMSIPKRRYNDFKNRSRTEQVQIIIATLAFALGFFCVGLWVFWSIYPYKTMVVKNVKMDKYILHQGDITNYSSDYVKYRPAEEVNRFFVDGLIFNAGASDPARPLGANHGVQPIQIPRTLPPGKYRLHVVITFKPNPIRTMHVEFDTPKFEVLPSGHTDEDYDREAEVREFE